MLQLLRLILWRHIRRRAGRTLLTVTGIVLGVAVAFAINVVNRSVEESFRNTVESIAGQATLTVGAGNGVAESVLETVRGVPGVGAAVPIIEDRVRHVGSGTRMMVLGVDTLTDNSVRDYKVEIVKDVQIEDDLAFLNDPRGLVITQKFADKHKLAVGDEIALETSTGEAQFTVRGTLQASGPAVVFGGDMAMMDIFAAQVAFGRGKTFDRIDVLPEEGVTPEALQARLSEALAGEAEVTGAEAPVEQAQHLMGGFQLAMSLAAAVALFVGGFIVYSTLLTAVAQQRQEIGTLRAVGATREQTLALFLIEALILGVFGAALGVAFGYLMAGQVLDLAASTVSAMYVEVRPGDLSVTVADVVQAIGFGATVAMVAAMIPALRAARLEPVEALRQHSFDLKRVQISDRLATTGAVICIAAAVALAIAAHQSQDVTLGYGVTAFASLAATLLAPLVTRIVAAVARRLTRTAPPSVLLGVVGFTRNRTGHAIAAAALAMALANVVNMDTLLNSIKRSTEDWFDRSVRADIIVIGGGQVQTNIENPMPASLGDGIRALPGVEWVIPYRMTRRTYQGRPYALIAYNAHVHAERNDVAVVEGDLEAALPALKAGTSVAISQSFASNFHVGVGDVLELPSPSGTQKLNIGLVVVDYSADMGVVMLDRAVYNRVWQDTLVDTFDVYLKEGADVDKVRQRIMDDFGDHDMLPLNNATYKAQMLKFIDGSFMLARATEFVALIVAVLGTLNTLLVTVADRKRELGVLKAVGADPSQVRKMVITESVLIAVAASLLGTATGAIWSRYFVKELLRFQIGWQVQWTFPLVDAVAVLVLAQLVVVVAALVPAARAARVEATQALQYD